MKHVRGLAWPLASILAGTLMLALPAVAVGLLPPGHVIGNGTSAPAEGTDTAATSTLEQSGLGNCNSGAVVTYSTTSSPHAFGCDAALMGPRKNYLQNPGMRIAQLNGSSSVTIAGSSNQNIAVIDRWRVAANGTGVITAQQIATASPGGSPNRFKLTVATADTSVASTSWYYMEQKFPCWESSDWNLGTAAYVPDLVFKFGVNAPAGTYGVTLLNNNDSYSYTTTFTVASGQANADTYFVGTIPGANSIGSFACGGTNGPIGAVLVVDLGSGSNAQGTGGQWNNGLFHRTSAQYSWIGTAGNTFQLFDTQLEVGSYPGPFVLPKYADDLRDAQVLLQPVGTDNNLIYGVGISQTTTTADMYGVKLSPPMPGLVMSGAPVADLNTTGTASNYEICNYGGAGCVSGSAVPDLLGYTANTVSIRFTVSSGLTADSLQRLQASSSSVWLFIDNQI